MPGHEKVLTNHKIMTRIQPLNMVSINTDLKLLK